MTPHPQMSIIIPAHNAAHYLRRTLPALRTGWRDEYELIIVDDASIDDTARFSEEAEARVIRLEAQTGPSGARNAGAQIARGEILAFLDADVEPHADTLRMLMDSLEERPDVAAVFGSYDDDPADRRLVSAFKNLMHHYVHQRGNPDAETFWTGCGAIRREVFQAVGPFHKVSLTCVEDIDYGHRLKDAGYNIWLRREIQCKHLKRWTLWSLVKTDVLHRGIPWTAMMMRRGRMDSELNLGWKHRLSAVFALGIANALVVLALAAVFAVFVHSANWNGGEKSAIFEVKLIALTTTLLIGVITGVISVFGMLGLQWNFYRFLASRRGWGFAAASVPLHVLYYWYSMIAVVAGFLVHVLAEKP